MPESIKNLIDSGEESKAFLIEFESALVNNVTQLGRHLLEAKAGEPANLSPKEASHRIVSELLGLHNKGKITNKETLFETIIRLHKQVESSGCDFYHYVRLEHLMEVMAKYDSSDIDEETIDALMRRL